MDEQLELITSDQKYEFCSNISTKSGRN